MLIDQWGVLFAIVRLLFEASFLDEGTEHFANKEGIALGIAINFADESATHRVSGNVHQELLHSFFIQTFEMELLGMTEPGKRGEKFV